MTPYHATHDLNKPVKRHSQILKAVECPLNQPLPDQRQGAHGVNDCSAARLLQQGVVYGG